jgi:HlyD family secretion protein
MRVVNPLDWLLLAAFGGLIGLGILWSILGRIPVTVTGKGVLINPRQVVPIQSAISGQLTTLNIREGDCVEKDAILATIDPALLKQQLQQEQDKLNQLQQQYQQTNLLREQRTLLEQETILAEQNSLEQQLRDTQQLTPSLRNEGMNAIVEQRRSLEQRLQETQSLTPMLQQKGLDAITQERLSLQQQLQDAEELLPVLKQRLEQQQELQQEGAISAERVLQAEQDYREIRQQISDIQAQLKQLEVRETELQQQYLENSNQIRDSQTQLQQLQVQETELQQQYLENINQISQLQAQLEELNTRSKRLEQENTEAINTQQNEIQTVQQNIARLEKEVNDNSTIKSAHGGCILELTATAGQYVNPGTVLGSFQRQGETAKLLNITYFAVKDGKIIKPGMNVLMTPDTIKRERYGGIVGKVTSISAFPVTSEGAISVVGNAEIAQQLMGEAGGKVEVIAEFNSNSDTLSGYQWSSSQGPSLEISSGTTTTTRVTIEERSPISFILPIIREWTGIYIIVD